MSNEIIEIGTGQTLFLTSEGVEMPFQILIGGGSQEMPLKLTMKVKSRRRRNFFDEFKKMLNFSLFWPRFSPFFWPKGGAMAPWPPP